MDYSLIGKFCFTTNDHPELRHCSIGVADPGQRVSLARSNRH